jgi:hypothetical protein
LCFFNTKENKELLEEKKIEIKEISISLTENAFEEMRKKIQECQNFFDESKC